MSGIVLNGVLLVVGALIILAGVISCVEGKPQGEPVPPAEDDDTPDLATLMRAQYVKSGRWSEDHE